MALIKWGALVVDGRGKIGGQVLAKNREGSYIRNKVTPVNPRTAFQQMARQQLGSLSAQWKGLTEAERDAWRNAVGDYMTTNVFGDSVKPTGKNLFVGLNRNLTNVGAANITTPATPIEFPVEAITAFTVTPSSLLVTISPEITVGDIAILIWATPPLSPGVNFVESEFRMVGTFPVQASALPIDFSTLYIARFGEATDKKKVFVRVELVSTLSGQKSVPIESSAISAK